jgi:hypothetical protein
MHNDRRKEHLKDVSRGGKRRGWETGEKNAITERDTDFCPATRKHISHVRQKGKRTTTIDSVSEPAATFGLTIFVVLFMRKDVDQIETRADF